MNYSILSAKKRAAESELAAANVLVMLGISSGEVTYNHARKVFGGWFDDAVAEGKLLPCRYGRGNGRNRWYRITDILALKALEYENLEKYV